MNLLKELNEEYKSKPFTESYPAYDHDAQFITAERRINHLAKLVDIEGKRVLEIGCGRGHVSKKLASDYGCDVVGIDIYENNVWHEFEETENLKYMVVDLSKENPFDPRSFDLIISFVVWEHITHPFKVLKECSDLIKYDGAIFIYANLYRSAGASHLYRTIYFPYPHLLFPDDIIIEYCLENGVSKEWIYTSFYVNKLTYAEYKEYFRIMDLKIEHEKLYRRKLDFEFYHRFEEKLGLYPIFDLELNYFEVVLRLDVADEIPRIITNKKIKSNKESPQKPGTPILWSIGSPDDPFEYGWYVLKDGERIGYIPYSASNCMEWTAEESGSYKIKVFVRDCYGNKQAYLSKEFIIKY